MRLPRTNFNYLKFTLLFFLYINVNYFKPAMGENKQNQRYYDSTLLYLSIPLTILLLSSPLTVLRLPSPLNILRLPSHLTILRLPSPLSILLLETIEDMWMDFVAAGGRCSTSTPHDLQIGYLNYTTNSIVQL